MTKALRTIKSDSEREKVARQRVANGQNTKGLGYWAAIDYLKKLDKKIKTVQS